MKIKNLLLLTLLVFSGYLSAQNIGINEAQISPDDSAILDVLSTNKGFLPPRMTQDQRDSIVNPAEGLVIFNTNVKCIEFWNGEIWRNICKIGSDTDDGE